MFIRILFLTFITLTSYAQSPMNYGEQRARQDTDRQTLEARRAFDRHIRAKFESEKKRLNLNHLTLSFNQRMIAQRARGAESAMRQIPEEMKKIMELISEARTNPRRLQNRLRSFTTLCNLSDEDIRLVVSHLANIRVLDLDYWGYLSRDTILPKYNSSSRKITFYSRWIEGESRYELTPSNQRTSLIIRGIHKSLNKKSWFDFF